MSFLVGVWMFVLGAVLCGCRDQAAKCSAAVTAAAVSFPPDSDSAKAFVAKCIKDAWTDEQIACVLRTRDGTIGSMFCFN